MKIVQPFGIVKIQLGMPEFTTLTSRHTMVLGKYKIKEGDKFYITNLPREQVKEGVIQIHRVKGAKFHTGFYVTLNIIEDHFIAEDYEPCLTKAGREERAKCYF